MYTFEIFSQKEKLGWSDWWKLIRRVSDYETNFDIEVFFEANRVEFYLYSKKDLSVLAAKLEGFVLKPVSRKFFSEGGLGSHKHINFRLSSKKNILEIKDSEEIKNGRSILKVVINFRKIIKTFVYRVEVFLRNREGEIFHSSYFSLTNPLLNFELDFKNNPKIKRKILDPFLKIDGAANLFTKNSRENLLGVFGFPDFSDSLYFPLKNFEFDKHTFIVGQTGVGKSKLIELFVKKIVTNPDLREKYAVVVVDPHASLYTQFLNLDVNKINFDFARSSCDLFPSFSEPKITTELTILLFKTLLKDQFNAKLERVLKYTLFVLFLQNQTSLPTLKKFLTELEFRKETVSNLGEGYEYLAHFFETEFVELQTKYYEIAIMPVLVLIDELSFIPAFFGNSTSHNLEQVLSGADLVSFSLNRIALGEKATRLIAGLLFQQLFLIAQKGSLKKKIILIIDEVSIVENDGLANILSEARKFNLSLFLSQQYLTQITPDLLKGILSNIYNYFVFKVSDEDAKVLGKNLDIVFPDEVLAKQKEKGGSADDLKRDVMVNLDPRECLARIFADGKFYPCFKAKTVSVD